MDPARANARSESSSLSSSDYSSKEEESRRSRRRKEKRHKRRKSTTSSSDNEGDDEKRIRKRKKERSRRRKHYGSNEESEDNAVSEDEMRKKKKKKRRYHSSDDEKERKKRKKRHRYSSSDEESSESESERRKKKKLLKKAKKILKEHKVSAKSDDQNTPKVEKISVDDYYSRNHEFATWLKETRGLYFSSLSSEESRKLFSSFVENWNAGKLGERFYQGIKGAKRTNHKWNIEDTQVVDEEEERLQRRKKEKVEQKKFQKEHELLMDEFLPKATGREALLEKKAVQREKNRNRDLSPEPMRERDLMGGGDDFKMMLARERARREKKANMKAGALHVKISAVEERETAAMDQFRALLNTSGGKITIPKRE